MNQYSLAVFLLGAAAVVLSPTTSASVISCPPSNPQEAGPGVRQLCYVLEQAMNENVITGELGRLDERNVNPNLNSKRQDVDHVFLRFGRRFGL